ncbi:IFI6/IFI27 family protein [Abortiporus biennis]
MSDGWKAALVGTVNKAGVEIGKTFNNVDTKAFGENIHSAVNQVVGEAEKILQNVDVKAVVDGAGAGIAVAAQKTGEEISKIDLKPAFNPTAQRAIIGVVATVAGPALASAPVVVGAPLSILGFSPTGPIAGSAAARMQSGIGNVAAGSAFATAQSLTMKNGTAASITNPMFASGLSVALYAAGLGLVKESQIPVETVGESGKDKKVSSHFRLTRGLVIFNPSVVVFLKIFSMHIHKGCMQGWNKVFVLLPPKINHCEGDITLPESGITAAGHPLRT